MVTRRLRTGVALTRNFARARVAPRHWLSSTRIAQEAIARHKAAQKLAELAPLLGVLAERRPFRIIEIGTGRGGTLWALCKVAAPDAHLVSVDFPGGPFGSGGYEPTRFQAYGQERQTITLIEGDSHTAETKAAIQQAVSGPVDFLFIDGDHNYAGVSCDYAMYAPLVREGGLIAFHDIVPGPAEYVGGVPRFWQEFAGPEKREIIDDIGSGGSRITGYGLGLVGRTGVGGSAFSSMER